MSGCSQSLALTLRLHTVDGIDITFTAFLTSPCVCLCVPLWHFVLFNLFDFYSSNEPFFAHSLSLPLTHYHSIEYVSYYHSLSYFLSVPLRAKIAYKKHPDPQFSGSALCVFVNNIIQ